MPRSPPAYKRRSTASRGRIGARRSALAKAARSFYPALTPYEKKHHIRKGSKAHLERVLMKRSKDAIIKCVNENNIHYRDRKDSKGGRIQIHQGSKGRITGLKKLSPASPLGKLNAAVQHSIDTKNVDYRQAHELAQADPRYIAPYTRDGKSHPGNVKFLTRTYLMKIIADRKRIHGAYSPRANAIGELRARHGLPPKKTSKTASRARQNQTSTRVLRSHSTR